ncbi:hypothetical protein OG417_22060 [Actinoallomurus sp. NBC_01490]|uniref:hypothetical protein n=1 Tax=Actinoallomurus sp. NBC_01490 TaxID=2903557 RepID=UPI002E2FA715|nr:hypothetical protein [Actinoallomurus sp. NBC_01490]
MATLVWWGFVGLASENFGSDCVLLGEFTAAGNHCYAVNQAVKAALPWLVLGAFAGAILGFCVPRPVPIARRAAVAVTMLCAASAFGLGCWALWLSP